MLRMLCPWQVVLYVDRLDMGRRDESDLQVARTITDVFGPDMWFSAATVLTHAHAPAPDQASSGQPLAFDLYVQQRQVQIQRLVRAVSGDNRWALIWVGGVCAYVVVVVSVVVAGGGWWGVL